MSRPAELRLDQVDLAPTARDNPAVSNWEQAKAVPRRQRIRKLAEVLRVDVMRYAGLPGRGEPPSVQADEPFHRLLGQVSNLANEQLIVLINQSWEDRDGLGFSLEDPRRH